MVLKNGGDLSYITSRPDLSPRPSPTPLLCRRQRSHPPSPRVTAPCRAHGALAAAVIARPRHRDLGAVPWAAGNTCYLCPPGFPRQVRLRGPLLLLGGWRAEVYGQMRRLCCAGGWPWPWRGRLLGHHSLVCLFCSTIRQTILSLF